MAKIPTQEKVPNQCPVVLRVLVIDHDSNVLENVKQMCNGCHYEVITYSNALLALNHVRRNKEGIDLILIDVGMPNLDDYELVKEIRKEIDVPFIVMSFDDSRSSRMESIKQGACDYWKKPFHEDQVRNMWVHVARKAWNDNKVDIKCGRLEDNDKRKREENDSKATRGGVKRGREPKRVNAGTSSKRQRIVWTDELHNKFLDAVSQLGDINTAVPKRILELMNVPGLTREQVASHLQKYRHQLLKNNSNEVKMQQKNGEPLATTKPARLEDQAFAVTGRVPCEMPIEEHHPGPGVEQQGTSYGHHPPLNIGNAETRIPQSMIMNVDEESGYRVWSPSADTMRQLSIQDNNALTMVDTLHLQHRQQRQEPLIMHPPSVNLHPSCILQVSEDSPIFHGYTTPAPAPAPAPAPPAFHAAANTLVPYVSGSSDSLYQQPPLVNFGYDDKQMYIPGTPRGHQIKESAGDEDHDTLVDIYMSTNTGGDDVDEAAA